MRLTLSSNIAVKTQKSINICINSETEFAKRVATNNRLIRAGTDITALTIGDSLKKIITGLDGIKKNIFQVNSILDLQNRALNSIGDLLRQMKFLAVIATNQLTRQQRCDVNSQFQSIKNEIARVSKNTTFNDIYLLNGTWAEPVIDIVDKGGVQINFSIGQNKAVYTSYLSHNLEIDPGNEISFSGVIIKNVTKSTWSFDTKGNREKAIKSMTPLLNKKYGAKNIDIKNTEQELNLKIGNQLECVFGNEKVVRLVEPRRANLLFLEKGNSIKPGAELRLNAFFKNNTDKKLSTYNINDSMEIVNYIKPKFLTQEYNYGMNVFVGNDVEDSIPFYLSDMNIPYLFRKEGSELDVAEIGPDINNIENAFDALKRIDVAISRLSSRRSVVGVSELVFDNVNSELENSIITQEVLKSRYQDTDYIKEPGNFNREQVKINAGISALQHIIKQQSGLIIELINSSKFN